jgi:hypothetical protein
MDQDREADPPATSGAAGSSPATPSAPPWAPPGAAPPPQVSIERASPDGPPPPPHVRRRRQRNRAALLLLAALLLVAVPVGLVVGGAFDEEEPPSAAGDADDAPDRPEGSEPDADDPDDGPGASGPQDGEDGSEDPGGEGTQPPAEPEPIPPDLDPLTGVDAEYGRLLIDVDASERVMIAFQDDLGAAFRSPPTGADALRERIREVAADRQRELLEVRARLELELDDAGADGVRDRYLAHLDSWAQYMAAIEEDPSILAAETDGGFTVAINATADAFSRALEEELGRGLDGAVERFAEAILDRGFRGFGQAEV